MTSFQLRWAAIIVLVAVAIACGVWGGLNNPLDFALVQGGVALRADYPIAVGAGVVLNYAGGAPATIGLVVGGAFTIWAAGRRREAIQLVAILIGGRLLIEILKMLVRRARPALDLHPVTTHSLSFPSAHAANSMIVFGALALAFAPPRHRISALIVAVLASLFVGASRPLLGVHWPSDVMAGWAVGAVWLLLWAPWLQRSAAIEAQHDIVGGHRAPVAEK